MKRISGAAVGVQSGSTLLFSAFEDGGEMWTGSGSRIATYHIRFEEPYEQTPTVHLSMTMWDTDVGSNQRLDVQAANITATGFDIEFRTWGDTRVARVRVSWMAIGPVPYVDDWSDD